MFTFLNDLRVRWVSKYKSSSTFKKRLNLVCQPVGFVESHCLALRHLDYTATLSIALSLALYRLSTFDDGDFYRLSKEASQRTVNSVLPTKLFRFSS